MTNDTLSPTHDKIHYTFGACADSSDFQEVLRRRAWQAAAKWEKWENLSVHPALPSLNWCILSLRAFHIFSWLTLSLGISRCFMMFVEVFSVSYQFVHSCVSVPLSIEFRYSFDAASVWAPTSTWDGTIGRRRSWQSMANTAKHRSGLSSLLIIAAYCHMWHLQERQRVSPLLHSWRSWSEPLQTSPANNGKRSYKLSIKV